MELLSNLFFSNSKRLWLIFWSVLISCFSVCVYADDQANIKTAFSKWVYSFNAKDQQHVCDLFSPDLRWVTLYPSYKSQEISEKSYSDICKILKRTIGDKSHHYHYSPHIKEILVSGDLAVVNVVWTLSKFSKNKKIEILKEYSMDIMKKQPDGKTWKMIRFVAYEKTR